MAACSAFAFELGAHHGTALCAKGKGAESDPLSVDCFPGCIARVCGRRYEGRSRQIYPHRWTGLDGV